MDQDNDLRVVSHNVPPGSPSAIFASIQNDTVVLASDGDVSLTLDNHDIKDGVHKVSIEVMFTNNISEDWKSLSESRLMEIRNESGFDQSVLKELEISLETEKSSSIFGSGETHRKMEKFDDVTRSCLTTQQMGAWGWALMFAEWVGGRETAMLTGGSAEVPPWYMAMVSLGMSIFFLCVQYLSLIHI